MAAIRTALLSEELELLRQLTGGAMMKLIPILHSEKLVRCGYAKIRAGALIITTMGHAKLAFEVTRAGWAATPG